MFPELSRDVLVCLARYSAVNILVLNIIAAPAAKQWNGTTGKLNRKPPPSLLHAGIVDVPGSH